jgi:hypothetical protein
LCAVGEGAYACLALSPSAPNEQNHALPWLITDRIQNSKKNFRQVLSNQEGNELVKKTISRYTVLSKYNAYVKI